MKTPTWRVTVYAEIYKSPHLVFHNPVEKIIVRAHTGPAAEEKALEKYPKCRVIRCERLTGYEGKS
jgi:hypothetical protein